MQPMQQKVLLVLGGIAPPLLLPLLQVRRPSNLYKLWQPAIRDDVIIRYFSQNHGVSVPFPGCVHNSLVQCFLLSSLVYDEMTVIYSTSTAQQ